MITRFANAVFFVLPWWGSYGCEQQRPHRGRGWSKPEVILGLWQDGNILVPKSAVIVMCFLIELNSLWVFMVRPRSHFGLCSGVEPLCLSVRRWEAKFNMADLWGPDVGVLLLAFVWQQRKVRSHSNVKQAWALPSLFLLSGDYTVSAVVLRYLEAEVIWWVVSRGTLTRGPNGMAIYFSSSWRVSVKTTNVNPMLERDEPSPDEWSNQDGALMTIDQSFFFFFHLGGVVWSFKHHHVWWCHLTPTTPQ